MITSVTSATIAATSTAFSWGAALAAGGAVLVIGLLIALELLDAPATARGGAPSVRRAALRRSLRVVTGPLLLVFGLSIVARVATILAAS